MRICFAIVSALFMLASCTDRHEVDTENAASALLQRLSNDGYARAEIVDNPAFTSLGGRTEMRCTVRYVSPERLATTAGVVATFTTGSSPHLETYKIDQTDPFRAGPTQIGDAR